MFFQRLLKPKPELKLYAPDFQKEEPARFTYSLESNLDKILQITGKPLDLVVHYLEDRGRPAPVLMYLKSLVDGALLGQNVAGPLHDYLRNGDNKAPDVPLARSLLHSADILEIGDVDSAVGNLMAGRALILLPNAGTALAVSLPGFPRRAIEDSPNEQVLKGSREGFTENLQDNLSLVRRWIKDPNLRVESKTLGTRTRTELAVIYLKDVADEEIVREVHKRLDRIKIDGIINSGYISELIADNKYTYFPLVQETERPDKVAAGILEGRVAILVDKSTSNILVPVTSTEYYQMREDFNFNYWVGTFLRFLRALSTVISITLPGLYMALAAVNPEQMPPLLVQLISSSRVQVPFSLVIELVVTMVIFEIFREAIIRMPTNISNILGIAGGLLLGQAALTISVVAPATIVVVVVTVLSTFTTADPSKEQAWRITRYFLLFAAAAFGIYGLALAGFIVLTHLASLKSFGVSYLLPWGPPIVADMTDALVRLPWWASYRRPPTYRPQDEDRLDIKKEEEEDNA